MAHTDDENVIDIKDKIFKLLEHLCREAESSFDHPDTTLYVFNIDQNNELLKRHFDRLNIYIDNNPD